MDEGRVKEAEAIMQSLASNRETDYGKNFVLLEMSLLWKQLISNMRDKNGSDLMRK